MKNTFIIGLSSWIIQDGNYGDFTKGDVAAFALQFYSPTEELSVGGAEDRQIASLKHVRSCFYKVVAKVVHIQTDLEWWAIDAGILMYRDGRYPREIALGSWVSGEIYLGIDPYMYMERYSRHHTAPGLIYDWRIHKIEMDIAPWIQISERGRTRDPDRPGWREIEKTDAWHDGPSAEYILHCELLDIPPRR
jgi:hypothetical protein